MKLIRFIILTSILASSGCNTIMKSAYGIKKIRSLNEAQINKLAGQLGIHPEESFILQDDYFHSLSKYDSVKPSNGKKCSPMISKYQQPLQACYFDERGNLISFHNNCNTGGFPTLNWNNKKTV